MVSSSKKCNELNLEEKVKLIREYKTSGGKESYESLAKKYSIGKTTAGRICRSADSVLAEYQKQNVARKRFRKSRNVEFCMLGLLKKQLTHRVACTVVK